MEQFILTSIHLQQVVGNLVDIHTKQIYSAVVSVADGVIVGIEKTEEKCSGYILPGLIDAHVHIESSLLTPMQFAHTAVRHGTVATVSDPHEIANVLGMEGVRFMIDNGKSVPFKFHWCAPSCVPATVFETAGGSISAEDIAQLLDYPEVVALAEMMNFPGVIFDDVEVKRKLAVARDKNFPIDGHAPGLVGGELLKYVQAGITTDHECTTYAEAVEKINAGMKILIRNGSSAKNFVALAELVDRFPDKVMLCCDDIHADDLLAGHINGILKLGVGMGLNLFNLVRAATINVADHYRLSCGMLRVGDKADFCIVGDLQDFAVSETWIEGVCVYKNGLVSLPKLVKTFLVNRFEAAQITVADIQITNTFKDFKVISVIDGELLTREFVAKNVCGDPFLASDVNNDILKIVVVNRYAISKPAVAFVKNFGLKQGAFASSVAHDSHNIIAVGVSDADLVAAINTLVESKGGLVAVNGSEIIHLPLPVAGLMSDDSAQVVSAKYMELKNAVREMGSELTSPFMTLSFMALLVIPELKLSDKGLFDGRKFEFTPLFV